MVTVWISGRVAPEIGIGAEVHVAFDFFEFGWWKTLSDVRRRRDEIAKRDHPDVGGRNEAMQEINLHYQVLENWFMHMVEK